ncbi:MAG: A/G-specific adenine glycosylase [Geminicoccaceae bacterium]
MRSSIDMLPLSQASYGLLIEALLAWYDDHRRDLPWRAGPGMASDSYHVLVSELMLQQTTVATVRRRFAPFIQRFPTLSALAAASEADVLHAWQGLGYYRRARALHACARKVVETHGSILPDDTDRLMTLPGLGAYTAKAVAAIAFNQPVVPVDGNVMRVLSRLFQIETPLPKAAKELHKLAAQFEPVDRPADTAQALMDLGATVCRPKAPECDRCPWNTVCVARASGTASNLPNRTPKHQRPLRQGVAFLLARSDGAVLFRRRPTEGLLGGLHELPSSQWRPAPIDREAALNEAPAKVDWRFHRNKVRHVFTHFALELDLAEAIFDGPLDGLWQPADAFDRLALPSVMKKLLREAGRL